MGILDSVLGALQDTPADGSQHNILASVLGMVNDPQIGGLSGLIEKISAGGLGEQVASWVSTGQNLPVTADQIQAVLGSSFVQELAGKMGINTADLSGSLANLLPQVIDRLTPDGQVPGDNKLLEIGLAGLTSLLANKTA